MAKSAKRIKALTEKRARKAASMKNTDGKKGNSKYATKKAYCDKHSVFGFQVSEPKPWKKAS